jgi:hypothetical protein
MLDVVDRENNENSTVVLPRPSRATRLGEKGEGARGRECSCQGAQFGRIERNGSSSGATVGAPVERNVSVRIGYREATARRKTQRSPEVSDSINGLRDTFGKYDGRADLPLVRVILSASNA